MENDLGPAASIGPVRQEPLGGLLAGTNAGRPAPVERPSPPADSAADDATITSFWEGNREVGPSYARNTVDQPSGQLRIQIRDAETHEIIRELAPDEVVRAARAIRDYLTALRARRPQPGQEK